MKFKTLYQEAVRIGIKNDLRGKNAVARILKESKKNYETLPDEEKEYFDLERLNNPYGDTRMLWGEEDVDVKNILIGIDMEGGEILLADRLRGKGTKVDLVLAHHPEGRALANLSQVMEIHTDVLCNIGVSESVAESLVSERIAEVERRLMPVNHLRSVDFARILDIPFMNIHTPADNCVNTYLDKMFKSKKPYLLKDVLDLLLKLKEYEQAARVNAGPKIIIGDKKSKAGKILVDMTGGTEGSKEMFSNLAARGVSTIVCMHLSEEHFKKAKEARVNAVIAGHIASDTLGLNLLLDEVEQKGKLKFIECSGFRRTRR